jgi:hypothetical protein
VHGERELSGINSNENEEPELQTKLETKSNCCYSAEHEGIGRMQEKWKIRYAKRKKKNSKSHANAEASLCASAWDQKMTFEVAFRRANSLYKHARS